VSRRQRLTLAAAILGSGIAMIDGTIVNVALPAIERDLGGGLPSQQWVSNGYLLMLASLILIGGSLGDVWGERRVFTIGIAAFGAFSLARARTHDRPAGSGPRAAGSCGGTRDTELARDHRGRISA
jgi:MFS family permease